MLVGHRRADVADPAPGAMPVTSATARIWAGAPYRRAPVGPTHTPIGTGDSAIRSISAAISASLTTAPRESTWRTSAWLCLSTAAVDRVADRFDHDVVEQAVDLEHVDRLDLRPGRLLLLGGHRVIRPDRGEDGDTA